MNNILKPLYESTTLKGNESALLKDIKNYYGITKTYTSYDDNRSLLDSLIASYLKGKNPKQFIYIELINNKPVYKLPREMTTYTKFVEKLDDYIKKLADKVGNDTAGAIIMDIKNKQLSTKLVPAVMPEYLAKSPNEILYFVFHNPTLFEDAWYIPDTKNWLFIHEIMHAILDTDNEELVQEETFNLMYSLGLKDELKFVTAAMFVLDMLGYVTYDVYTITDYIIETLVAEDPHMLTEIMSVVYELAIVHNVEEIIEAAASILNIVDKYYEREL